MENTGQVFSLWVGPQSQQLAHHFYALQAQQFFDESQDPTRHQSIWKLYDKSGQKKMPYFLTFDCQIEHLNHMRQCDQQKLINALQKNTMQLQQYYFPMQYQKKEQPKQRTKQKDSYLYQRWQAAQSNYVVIDKNFIQDCDSYDFWKDIYNAGKQLYEDKIRKQLERFDCLSNFTLTSDINMSGFSQEILTYLKDQCPKKDLLYFQLEGNNNQKGFYQVNQLSTLSQIATLSQAFFSLKVDNPQYKYFETQNPFLHLAPLMNCLLTPLFLKEKSVGSYLSNILTNPRRNIFDIAYNLPIIDKDLNICKNTNIFDYLQQGKNQKFFEVQQSSEDIKKHKQMVADMLSQEKNIHQKAQDQQNINRINYSSNYMDIHTKKKITNSFSPVQQKKQLYSGVLTQAYVIKGHVSQFDKLFSPNTELLDCKYLQGILCNYDNKVKYTKQYVKSYGQDVVNYPFHCVMFQHQEFGNYLRKLATRKNKKQKHQMEENWRDNLMNQADLYKEIIDDQDMD